jgi:hypothetical protein
VRSFAPLARRVHVTTRPGARADNSKKREVRETARKEVRETAGKMVDG